MAAITQMEIESSSLKCVFRDGYVVDSWHIVCYYFITYYLRKNIYCYNVYMSMACDLSKMEAGEHVSVLMLKFPDTT